MQNMVCNCVNCKHQLCTKRVPIFSALNQDELSQITSLIVRKHFKKGQLIIMEGDLLDSLIIISSGMIKTFRYTPDGREQILFIFSDGDFFGEMNLLSNEKVQYNAEALEDTNVCMINKTAFRKLLVEHPQMSFKIMEELCSRLNRLENMVQGMGAKDAELLVNMALLEFSQKYGVESEQGILIDLPLSREGIANYIGVARETVSRKFSKLQDDGVIQLIGNKKVLILNKKALKQNI